MTASRRRSSRPRSIWRASASRSGRGDRRHLRQMRPQWSSSPAAFGKFSPARASRNARIPSRSPRTQAQPARSAERVVKEKSPRAALSTIPATNTRRASSSPGTSRSRPSAELRLSLFRHTDRDSKGHRYVCARGCGFVERELVKEYATARGDRSAANA